MQPPLAQQGGASLFVAIDPTTRWVFLHIYGDMTDISSVDFLRRMKLAPPSRRRRKTVAQHFPRGGSGSPNPSLANAGQPSQLH
jgi:hypothetical protein